MGLGIRSVLAIRMSSIAGVGGVVAARPLDGRVDLRVGKSALLGQQQAEKGRHPGRVHRAVAHVIGIVRIALGIQVRQLMTHGAEVALSIGDLHRHRLDGRQHQRVGSLQVIFRQHRELVPEAPRDLAAGVDLSGFPEVDLLLRGDQGVRLGLRQSLTRRVGRIRGIVARQQSEGSKAELSCILVGGAMGQTTLENQGGLGTVVGSCWGVGPERLQGDGFGRRHPGAPAQHLETRGRTGFRILNGQGEASAGIGGEGDRVRPRAVGAEDHIVHREDAIGG